MRLAVLLMFCCTGSLWAQIDPPSLRCLEVLPNGDVKLTWIPPSDPNGKFQQYEIHSSISGSGFAPVATGIGPLATFSFVHSGATATAQTRYYYMVTRFSGGTGISPASDTLRTIFLNVTPGSDALQLTYNQLRQPPLQTSSANFTVTKEYPIGTVNNLAITPATKYPDTIDVCSARINYQVSLSDISGCVSRSNLIIGNYQDTKVPDSTSIDSISVLPDGRTIVAWSIPTDRDIDRYKIIEHIPPQAGNFYIDSLKGRNNTSYTYSSTAALDRQVALFVSALDSCEKIGPFDETPRTIFLKCVYRRCEYRTELSWTEYKGMKKGILEYRVYYSVDGGTFKRIGSTTGTAFVHGSADPGRNLCYFVRVVNKDQTITASSNQSCFFSTQVRVPQYIYLAAAGVAGNKSIEIRLFADNSRPIEKIDIERSVDSLNFALAGSVAYTGQQAYTFTDNEADPGSTSYYYRALFRDSCGNPRSVSNTVRTVLLKVREDQSGLFTRHLSWNAYEGFAGKVSGYYVYRLVNGEAPASPVGTTGPDVLTYTDNLENEATEGALVEYLVSAREGVSNPYGIRETANSNRVPVYMEGTIFVPNAFSPPGENKTWRPVTHFIDKTDYRVTVFDRWGKSVFDTLSDREAWDGSGCQQGVYVYLIRYKNSRGEYRELTGHLTLIR